MSQGKGATLAIFFNKWEPDIAFFQETKIKWISSGIVQGFWGGSFSFCQPQEPLVVLILMWDKRVME